LDHDGFAPELSFLVRHRGETVAASVNFRAEPDTGSIGMLGVRAPWRRRGLGRALLLHSFDAFRAAGLRSARLGVDAGNTDRAVALYESVGMAITRRDLLFERTLGS
jgi:ribosomal protein S18 acetylase RimI-like enzyme